MKWLIIISILVCVLVLMFFFGNPARTAIVAGIFTGILIAFVAVSCYAHAETLEDRIDRYEELHGIPKISKFIFVGDSRTVGMQAAIPQNEDIWSCKEAIGYDWMVSEGIPSVETQITDNSAVFVLLGVNDLGNGAKYAEYLNSKASAWKGKAYFVSVGPVCNTTVTNAQIESFNSIIRDNADSYKYIDLYNNMNADGFSTVDGLHYTAGTYQYIYNFLKDSI